MTPIRCANSPTAAQVFVQLSLRQQNYMRAASKSSPVLALFLPAVATRACSTKATTTRDTYSLGNIQRDAWRPGQAVKALRANRPISKQLQQRAFGTSSPRRRTEAVFNPQHDDEGEEMVLAIAPGAAKVG